MKIRSAVVKLLTDKRTSRQTKAGLNLTCSQR